MIGETEAKWPSTTRDRIVLNAKLLSIVLDLFSGHYVSDCHFQPSVSIRKDYEGFNQECIRIPIATEVRRQALERILLDLHTSDIKLCLAPELSVWCAYEFKLCGKVDGEELTRRLLCMTDKCLKNYTAS